MYLLKKNLLSVSIATKDKPATIAGRITNPSRSSKTNELPVAIALYKLFPLHVVLRYDKYRMQRKLTCLMQLFGTPPSKFFKIEYAVP